MYLGQNEFDFEMRFKGLSQLLADTRPLWHENPYKQETLSWQKIDPAAWQWVESMNEAELDAHEHHPELSPFAPTSWLDLVKKITAFTQFPLFTDTVEIPKAATWRLPTKKKKQIQSFLASIRPKINAHLIDWCAGKGHLGRFAALSTEQALLQVEREASLCQAADSLNHKLKVNAKVQCMDVLKDDATWPSPAVLMALHACGDLGTAALELHKRIGGVLALAPCCHHKIESEQYRPLSVLGQAFDLNLDRSILHFSVAFETCASPKTRRTRRQGMAYRCALSAAQNAWHVPSRPCPRSWLSLPFAEFAAKMAQRDGIVFVGDPVHFLEEGKKRARRIRARAMLRAPFRRAIEVWLALDRALSLQSLGRQVDLVQFCPSSVSPRNLLLLAH